jgi:5'(3')-deoxyribonucleotidase
LITIAIDQDTVLADLTSKWLSVYNHEYQDNLTPDQITEWDISSFCKCGLDIYKIVERPHFYADLPVVPGSQEGVRTLIELGYNVCIASASPFSAYQDKEKWINVYFPQVPKDNIIFTRNKSLVAADILIDDGTHNLEVFNGLPILFDAPWNRSENRFVRVRNWAEITGLFGNMAYSNHKITPVYRKM